jgi:hypothetical protein
MAMITPPPRIGAYAPGVTPKPAGKARKPMARKMNKRKAGPLKAMPMQGLINRAQS